MLKLHDASRSRPPLAGGGGFTTADLIALDEVRFAAIARQIWGRAQLVSNEFAHYLAIWRPGAGVAEPPGLALARFRKTGTYMLMIGATVVASGKSLRDVLPALPCAIAAPNLAD
jgi:hypothetical protein